MTSIVGQFSESIENEMNNINNNENKIEVRQGS